MKSFGMTDKGAVRANNEDCFLIEKCPTRDCLVLGLCDGMGGARAGELASSLAVKAFVNRVYERLNTPERRRFDYHRLLQEACDEANGAAYTYSHFSEEYEGMGTTLVGGVIKNRGNGYIINVGDSRAYLISRRGIRQITRDHSLVEDLVEMGAITRDQARTHPRRNVITRALGSPEPVEGDIFEFTLQPGEVLLLCSDGLSNTVEDEQLQQVCLEEKTAEAICSRLMQLALDRGASDNVTMIAVKR